MKIDRLLGILNILAERKRITADELAERFEVSKRTIFRDIDTLNQSGIPITSYSGNGGGIALIEGYKYDKSIFSKNDIKNMFTALKALMSINKNEDIINLMAKVVPQEESNIFSESDYLFDLSSWFKDSLTMKKINDIHKALEDHKCIKVQYISKTSRKIRIIHPYKIVFKQSYWYVYGFCEDADDFRIFKINRIVSYEILDATFEIRLCGNIDFKDDLGSELYNEKNLYTVILEYNSCDEFLLTNKIDAKFFCRKENEEKGRITFKVSDLDWAVDMVISMMDKVKVKEPLELKEKVKLKINKMAEIYKDDI